MITRQSCYLALYKLKNAGINIDSQIELMTKSPGVPREVILFLRENSPQFQYYRYLQKHQKALVKNILNYDTFDNIGKVKVCSSLITRAMIAIEYKDFDQSLMYELDLEGLSEALSKAFNDQDYSKLNESLEKQRESMKLFLKEK
jgi:hypothetical protein